MKMITQTDGKIMDTTHRKHWTKAQWDAFLDAQDRDMIRIPKGK